MTHLTRFPILLAALLASCATSRATLNPDPAEAPVTVTSTHPMLAEWTGPYGGLPPFDRVEVKAFAPALDAAMAGALSAIDAIAANPEAPTFENTNVAFERAGRPFERVMTLYGVFSSSMSSDEFQAVEREVEPKLAAFYDQITQHAGLFARIEAVYAGREAAGLTPEQQRIAWLDHKRFVRAGAKLDAAAKARLAAINQQLAGHFTTFSQNVLADESDRALIVDRREDLDGLPGSFVAAAAAAAAARGEDDKWAIANTRSAMEPFLTYATRRDLRERVWRTYVDRGDNGDEHDNNAVIAQILALRAERAALLGYETHAHWRLENTMAKTPARAMELLEAVWTPAVARVAEEVADMQALADAEGAGITIAPWDYRFYAEKVRKAKYDLDESQVTPYLRLDNLRDGMFWVAGQLFGLDFAPIDGVPVYHPDVTVFEVTRNGEHVGLWYFDPYARKGKHSGAWMNEYRTQRRVDGGASPIVSNNANFLKPDGDAPVLISWTDAETLFHEFGHALHGLCSNVTYPQVAGTAVVRDYVEFPSQLLEHWLATPEVLQRFALHHETNEPMPAELLARIQKAATFNTGFQTVEYLASALIDMKLHLAGATPIEPDAFERETLAALGMPKEIVMRHRTPQFGHVFAGDGYSAGYYSYLWSDTLTADAWEAFEEGGGAYDAGVAKRLHDHVFSIGNTVPPEEGYRAFRGRDPGIGALMRKRGFATE